MGCGGDPDDWLWRLAASRRHLALIAAVVAAVYLAGVTGKWRPTPDSAAYLGLGRAIANGEGYRFNGEVNTQFPPGLPVILAGVRLVAGEDFWVANLFVTLCGLGALLVAYRCLRRIGAEPPLALLAALATAASFNFYLISHHILSDMPYTLIFWALLYAAISYLGGRSWALAAAIVLTVAGVLVRVPSLLLTVPLAVGIVLDGSAAVGGSGGPAARRKWTAACAIAASACLTTVVLYVLARRIGQAEPRYVTLVSGSVGADPLRLLGRLYEAALAWPLTFTKLVVSQDGFWFAGLPIMALALVGLVVLWREKRRAVPTLVVLYLLSLAASLGSWGMAARYLVPIAPLLFYVSLLGLHRAVGFIAARLRRPPAGSPALAVLMGVLLICNMPRLAREAFYYSYLSYTPRYYEAIQSGKFADFMTVADLLRRRSPPQACVATEDSPSVLCYLTGRLTIPLPSTGRRGTTDVRTVLDFLDSHTETDFVVLDGAPEGKRFVKGLQEALSSDPAYALLFRGRYLLYQRVGPPAERRISSTTATAQGP